MKYSVKVERTVTHTTMVEVRVEDEDSACELAEVQAAELESSFEWELEDDKYEAIECSEG